jgi:hypothetical protein
MEKLFLLSSGLTLAIGIFNEESSPLVVVILSSVGDFVHISSGDDTVRPTKKRKKNSRPTHQSPDRRCFLVVRESYFPSFLAHGDSLRS